MSDIIVLHADTLTEVPRFSILKCNYSMTAVR